VRLPKGFGKNYFTLRAITATSNQVTLNANISRVQSFHMLQFSSNELEAESEEEELAATLCTLSLSSKPCHCNCYFFKKTRKTLLLHPNQNYFLNYFKNLNNAISPPYINATKRLLRHKFLAMTTSSYRHRKHISLSLRAKRSNLKNIIIKKIKFTLKKINREIHEKKDTFITTDFNHISRSEY
jgi:hypothetical protein